MSTDSLNDVRPILRASTFESSSSDLAEDLPSPIFEQVVEIAEHEQLLLEFNEEFGWIAIAKCVEVFFHIVALVVLERGLDCVLALASTLDLEDGF